MPTLFTEEFCHPRETDDLKIKASWLACLGKDSAECTGPCAFNNGVNLIPKLGAGFCAPAKMTKDSDLVVKCINSDEAACNNECEWRKAKEVASNDNLLPNAPLFESNFCHPAVADSWDKDYDRCIVISNGQACE